MLPDLFDQIEELKKRISVLERFGNSAVWIINEIPSGDIDGTNTVFTVRNDIVYGKSQVFKDGLLLLGDGNDYWETDDREITFVTAPQTGSVIVISYQTSRVEDVL